MKLLLGEIMELLRSLKKRRKRKRKGTGRNRVKQRLHLVAPQRDPKKERKIKKKEKKKSKEKEKKVQRGEPLGFSRPTTWRREKQKKKWDLCMQEDTARVVGSTYKYFGEN